MLCNVLCLSKLEWGTLFNTEKMTKFEYLPSCNFTYKLYEDRSDTKDNYRYINKTFEHVYLVLLVHRIGKRRQGRWNFLTEYVCSHWKNLIVGYTQINMWIRFEKLSRSWNGRVWIQSPSQLWEIETSKQWLKGSNPSTIRCIEFKP